MKSQFTKDQLKSHLRTLVENLLVIHKPDEFQDQIDFQGIPKVKFFFHDGIINGDKIEDGQAVTMHVDNKSTQFAFHFGAHPRSEITEDHVQQLLGDSEHVIDNLTRSLESYFVGEYVRNNQPG